MDVLCSYSGCAKKSVCKGLCAAHYQQQRKGEELKPLQVQYHGLSESSRLLMRCEKKGPEECWDFIGSSCRKGWHGQFHNDAGKNELAHRAAWRLFVGPIPEGMFVLHKCDNPVCLNPLHLFLGTQSDNAKDMWSKGRANPKPSLGSSHGMSKLNDDAVREILASSESGKALAGKFGVSQSTIGDVRKRRIWKHVT